MKMIYTVRIPLTGLMPPHFGSCPKPGRGFPTPYVVDFFVFNYFMWLFVLLISVELLTITV